MEGTCLFGGGVLDGADETADLVAHGLGGDAGGDDLEVDVAAAANAGVEVTWVEGTTPLCRGDVRTRDMGAGEMYGEFGIWTGCVVFAERIWGSEAV